MIRHFCEPNRSISNNSTAYRFSQSLSDISTYTLPVLSVAGNSLTLLVILTNSQLNRSSFSVYVKSMAITDTFVLLFKLLSFLNKTSKYYFPSLCTILIFCSDASVLLSIWTIVLITIERTLVVLFPLHIKKFVSACRARVIILILALSTIIFSARILFIQIDTSFNDTKRCFPKAKWNYYRQINIPITEFAYCYIPLTIVIIGNILTICTVTQATSRRHDMLPNNSSQQNRQIDSNKNQLMFMLVMVTLMFIVYFVPFTIINVISRLGLPFKICITRKSFETFLIMRSLSELLKDLNFCTNFIIYCVSGRRFRNAFFSLFKRHPRQPSINSRYFETQRNRSEFLLKNHREQRFVALSTKNTVEESQF